jgi:hypothetical protein
MSRSTIVALALAWQLAPAHAGTSVKAAMAKLAFMSGVWIGTAEGVGSSGDAWKVTQTERMGPMLDGDIIVMEGRGYKSDGATAFNNFAVVSWDVIAQKYELRWYSTNAVRTVELKLTADGYVWEISDGSNMTTRYTATVKDKNWREVGELIENSKPPRKIFELNLKRVRDTDWPNGKPVPPK